jgi:predicted MFS family arabinose efflux permease
VRVLGAFAAAVGGLAVFAHRSSWHPVPVVEPAILRLPGFGLANVATLIFFGGFGAMLLGASLFLTGVWGYSVLQAGLALAPGPVMAAVGSVAGGRVVAARGPRAAAVPGGLLFAASMASLAVRMDATPRYLTEYLPANAVGGFGIGLVIASLTAAVAATLPPARFATGTAIYSMARQIGLALGVAVLVAIVAHPDPADPVGVFHTAWVVMAGAALATVALASLLAPARRPVPAPAPA